MAEAARKTDNPGPATASVRNIAKLIYGADPTEQEVRHVNWLQDAGEIPGKKLGRIWHAFPSAVRRRLGAGE